jgi:hypothetical protein
MKKLFVVLAILFVGILLAGCTSQPSVNVTTTAPTTVPTAVPTIVPTVNATVVPTVNITPNQTATTVPTPTPTPRPSFTITFTTDMRIMPSTSLTVPVGSRVVWVNNDPRAPHGVEAVDGAGAKYFGGTIPGQIPFGKSFNVTFDTVGSFDYRTTFQPATTGRITVTK